jgi:hypothetical protein
MRISEDGSLLLLLLLTCRLKREASEQPTTLSSLSGGQEDEEAATDLSSVITSVSKHMGWVRNVVLMNVYSGSGKPRGVGIWVGEGPDGQDGEIQGSVYEQPKGEVDGSHHSKEGSK